MSNTNLETYYKNLKQQVRSQIHHAKSEYYNNRLKYDRDNSRATWKTITKLLPEKKSTTK